MFEKNLVNIRCFSSVRSKAMTTFGLGSRMARWTLKGAFGPPWICINFFDDTSNPIYSRFQHHPIIRRLEYGKWI